MKRSLMDCLFQCVMRQTQLTWRDAVLAPEPGTGYNGHFSQVSGKRDMAYVQVTSSGDTCDVMHSKSFTGLDQKVEFVDLADVFSSKDMSIFVYLLPTPNGDCVSVKQQVIYRSDLLKPTNRNFAALSK